MPEVLRKAGGARCGEPLDSTSLFAGRDRRGRQLREVMDKLVASADAAVCGLRDGTCIAVGGFGSAGVPTHLIDAIHRLGISGLHIISNNCGSLGWGLGTLLESDRISMLTASFPGGHPEFLKRFQAGSVSVNYVPQGILAEALRAGGAGIPAFYTSTGIGTPVAEGGVPIRYDKEGRLMEESEPAEVRSFDGQDYILRRALTPDVALVRAACGDSYGNLVFRGSARNFNPVCAMAARLTLAEVEQCCRLKPDEIHLPGAFVDRVVEVGSSGKRIEIRAIREDQ